MLWTIVDLNRPALAMETIRRSKGRPLLTVFSLSLEDASAEVLEQLTPGHRIASLWLQVLVDRSQLEQTLRCATHSATTLESMDLRCDDVEDPVFAYDICGPAYPQLCELYLQRCLFRWTAPVYSPNLRVLHIDIHGSRTYAGAGTVQEFLSALRRLGALEELSLDGISLMGHEHWQWVGSGRVSLPRLERLRALDTIQGLGDLLSRLDLSDKCGQIVICYPPHVSDDVLTLATWRHFRKNLPIETVRFSLMWRDSPEWLTVRLYHQGIRNKFEIGLDGNIFNFLQQSLSSLSPLGLFLETDQWLEDWAHVVGDSMAEVVRIGPMRPSELFKALRLFSDHTCCPKMSQLHIVDSEFPQEIDEGHNAVLTALGCRVALQRLTVTLVDCSRFEISVQAMFRALGIPYTMETGSDYCFFARVRANASEKMVTVE